jgi:RHS repeat-associated protein
MRGMPSGRLRVRGQRRRRLRAAHRAGIVTLALVMLPMLMGAGSAGGQAPMPTLAGIRGAIVRLADWVAGRTPPKPPVPRQLAGKAPGRQHQVPAAVTRAVARARGHAPGRGPGQLPAYAYPAARVSRHVTGVADLGGAGSYDPATSKLVPSRATAASKLYRNADGSYTRLEYPAAAGHVSDPGTLAFSGPAGVGVKGTHVTFASLQVLETWAGGCPSLELVNVSDSSGRQVGYWAGKPPASACGTGSRGSWVSVPVSGTGLRELSSRPGIRLTVAAAAVAPAAARFITAAGLGAAAGSIAAAAPAGVPAGSRAVLMVTSAANGLPQIDSMWPANGYNTPTLTPELIASGSESSGSVKWYQFAVFDSTGTWIAGSPWVTTNDWVVPSGTLAWDKTYYWAAQAIDSNGNSGPDSPRFALQTPVPQPLLYQGLSQDGSGPDGSQNGSGPVFDPQNGNFTTQATDASEDVTGPPLSIQRTYNSLEPLAAGAFGTGWSSVLDMKISDDLLAPDGTTTTEVVTYPDGEKVTFGKNADGSYTSPQGRYGTLTPAPGGGFQLIDKGDSIYTLSQPVGSTTYTITSITDAQGHALNFTYSGGQITKITSATSQRSLQLTWSTPSGASFTHVTKVVTDPVTANQQSTAITWQYNYSGDQLSSACNQSQSGQPCTAYAYQSGTGYPAAVANFGPQSYWRLNEASGTTAASSVLANEGTDNGTYAGVVQDVQPGPLAGSPSSVGAAGFDYSYVQLPASLANEAGSMSVSLWFNSTAANGVLFSQSADSIPTWNTASPYSPVLYIGASGKLHGGFAGTGTPLGSSSAVNNGKWHNVVLTSNGTQEALYIDGSQVASKSVTVTPFVVPNVYLGAGFIGGSYPDEQYSGQSPATVAPFFGAMSDAATWDRPLTAAEVSLMYQVATNAAPLLTKITRPSGKVFEQASYDPVTAQVRNVTDASGGTWAAAAPADAGSSRTYAAAVLGTQPEDYWRLADTGTTTAVNQFKSGIATYSNVTQGVPGGPFADTTVDGFNGSSSYLALPNALISPGNQSVSLWFKTTATDGVLLSSSADPVTGSTTTHTFTPNLYIGQDGNLNGEFSYGNAPIATTTPVNDGQWHNVVLAAGTSGQVLYLDGKQVGGKSGTISGGYGDGEVYDAVGMGFLGYPWADQPHNSPTDTTGYRSSFNGNIAEVAFYPHQMTADEVTAQWVAAQRSQGLSPVETSQVTDPGNKVLTYRYDPLNSGRLLSQTDGLGDTTSYGYDSLGFQDEVTDPNGDVTDTGHDPRGNVVATTTCQNQAAGKCSTSYASYSPDDTSAVLKAPYSGNDLVTSFRDARSASATDNAYLTTDAYNSAGELASTTSPPVPGYPSGRITTYSYTDGTTTAGGANSSTVPPAGLLWKTVTPGTSVTETLYNANGDVRETIDGNGVTVYYSYDGIGRKVSQDVFSGTFPNGLVTSYAYDADGLVTQQTNPAVTDQVTGTVHTPQVASTYDADGDLLSQATADTTGHDAARTVSATWNGFDQKATSTDAAGAVTQYAYDGYGNLASQTDPAGNVTQYAYDPDGHLLTTTLANYTGSPSGSQPAAPLIQDSRAYDPAGRLASVTDAMGRVTSYAYTDDGLSAAITRTGPGGGSYAQKTSTYDPAGNLITQVTNNGATTTNYNVDAADQVTSQAVDPSGLDRVTAYTYTPDDHVATQNVSQGSGSPIQATSYTYDLMGNKTSQTVQDPGAEGPAGWWKLTQSSGTTVADSSGTGNLATAGSGVTWTGNGGAVLSGQSGQQVTTRGPVMDTTRSFSVSAWVNLAGSTGTDQSAIAQDAGSVSGFYLGLDSGTGKWKFTRPEEDRNSPPDWATAKSGNSAQTGTWTFLTGVYDANAGTIQLYVNGAGAGSALAPTPIAASGPLEIGGGKWDGQAGAFGWDGSLTNVEAYPTALSAAEVANLYNQGSGGGNLVRGALTTSYQVDQLGQVTAETNPDQGTTSYAYDAAGRQAVVTQPSVATETGGGTPAMAHPATLTGYNTFGEVTESKDPDGNVTTYAYDADGRQVSQTLPSYTPPGGSAPVSGTSTTTYNTLGQVTAQTDPLGNTTHYTYDQLGDRTGQTDPGGGVTTTAYDADGEVLSVTGPTGAQSTGTYDFLGRQLTSTDVERHPSPASYTTTTSYAPTTTTNPSGTWKSSVTSPDGVATSYGYDAAGETTQVTDGAGNVTRFSFDALGRQTASVNPDGTSATVTYDPAGNQLAQSSLDASRHTLTTESATYNGEGQQLSTTDALGDTIAYTYNAAGGLTAETQPVSSSAGIVTSFGYDAAGNQTRYTDGNGRNWITAYNSWNLPGSQVEPATSQYSTPASSTTTIAYNGDGKPVTATTPGGVTITDTYNAMNEVTGQSGSGATAATATRSFSYDAAGNMLTAATTSTAGSGQPSNATSETFTWNDRGLLLTSAGSAGSTSYTWNGDGQQASVNDAAGLTSYGYDSAGRLHTLADPASGATLTYSYNPMSQPSRITYGGSGADTRSFGYNSLHELTSDTLTAGSTTVASISYGYDLNGDITSKATTGFVGGAANTYTYDQAGRLTSWNNGTTTTSYAYDGAGNRVQAGSTNYAYDARDQLTSDGTSSYSYSANGDLTSVTGSSGTATSTSDAYGQQGAQGSQSNTYDALGRDVGLAVTNGATTALSYEGTTGQLTSDGAASYTWTPDGTLTGTANSPGTGVLDFTDHHTDLTGQFTANGAILSGSRTFGPWGASITVGGTLAGTLGYQSQYTSPATGQVDMGARWYNPSTGSFGNKDTVANKPVPDSASASPFGYAADNPLGATDPTGHQVDPPQSAATAKALAADAHAAHLAHLAHLAVLAKQAPAVKAAASKIPTYCATGALTMGAVGACESAVYSAAGGPTVNGVPVIGKGYNASIASQALKVVQKQYEASLKAITPIKTNKPADTSVEISPHIYVAANDPNLAKLRAAYQWAASHHGPLGGTDEYDIWQRACTISPERSACNGVLNGYLHTNIPFEDIAPSGWALGFGAILSAKGVAAAIILPGTPASQAALQALLARLVSHVYNNKTVAQVIKAYESGTLNPQGGWKISGEGGPEYKQMLEFLNAQYAANNLPKNTTIASAAHPETWFATLMAEGKITSRDIVITNPNGVCEACKLVIPQILPQGDGVTITSPSGPGGKFVSEYIPGQAVSPAGPAGDAAADG